MRELCCYLSGERDDHHFFDLNFCGIALYDKTFSQLGLPLADPRPPATVELASRPGTVMSQEIRGRAREPSFMTKEEHKGTGRGLNMTCGFA